MKCLDGRGFWLASLCIFACVTDSKVNWKDRKIMVGSAVNLSNSAITDLATNITKVRFRMEKALSCKSLSLPTLVAVSKRQPDNKIEAALATGHRVFGENRVQEAKERWVSRRGLYPELRLHLIGPLQNNKAADAVALFDVIEVVDRPKLARSLSTEMIRQGRRLPCYVQVNTGEEDQKSGIWPEEADDFIVFCRNECSLDIAGLMCIPPVEEEPAMHFALLRTIAERNGLSGLSMGMSGDYEEAVRFGATSVRVGTAIFGSRDS